MAASPPCSPSNILVCTDGDRQRQTCANRQFLAPVHQGRDSHIARSLMLEGSLWISEVNVVDFQQLPDEVTPITKVYASVSTTVLRAGASCAPHLVRLRLGADDSHSTRNWCRHTIYVVPLPARLPN